MSDEFAHEYDTVMNAWVDTTFANGSASSPVGRRDHTLEARGDYIYLMAGINNSEDALMDMWSIYFSRYTCT